MGKSSSNPAFAWKFAYLSMLAEDEAPFDEAFCVGIAEGTLDPSEAVKYGVPGKILANFLVAAERFVFSNPPSFGSPEAYERTAKAIHSAVWAGVPDVSPGSYRRHDVTVGIHTPPKAYSLGVEMREWAANAFHMRTEAIAWRMGKKTYVASCVTGFLRVHPFSDLNGRTARLFCNALSLDIGLRASVLWPDAKSLTLAVRDAIGGNPAKLEAML